MAELITVFIITIFAAISPGPDFAMVVRNSVRSGKHAGFMTAVGIGLGLWVHVFYSIIGIGAIVSQSIILFNILKLVCAAYLIYLGVRMIIEAGKGELDLGVTDTTIRNSRNHFLNGFLTNALNPKATIFIVSLFTQVVNPDTSFGTQLLYGAVVSVFHIVWFALLARFFSAEILRQKISGFRHWFDKAFGGTLAALGLTIVSTSLQSE